MNSLKSNTVKMPVLRSVSLNRKAVPSVGRERLFSNRQLFSLLMPLILEQLLNMLMGMTDTIMVSQAGSTAISAVSLTDSINTLIIQVFTALAAGGTILCAKFVGQGKQKRAEDSARQVMLVLAALSALCSLVMLIFSRPLLRLIFGKVSSDVMDASWIYFFITIWSFPFFAVFQGCGSIYRAWGNSRLPMLIAFLSNAVNIAGNALLIFVFHMSVAGAAISTLGSRILSAVMILLYLHGKNSPVHMGSYLRIRPDLKLIRQILCIGIPAGLENGMFQFGKLAIQSSVSTLGTVAIAANAMASIFETLDGVGGMGIGIGLMTVIGRCMGAGCQKQAKYYFAKLSLLAEFAITFMCLTIFAFGKELIALAGMEPDAAALCYKMLIIITIAKPVLWVPSFIPPYAFRAAGDINFSAVISSLSMWLCRVMLTIVLINVYHVGIIAVWIGMFADWAVRDLIYTIRCFSGKWLRYGKNLSA